MLTIETGNEEYRIVCGDDEGDTFPYGETAILVSGGRLYVASLYSATDPDTGFELAVYQASKRVTNIQAVDFSDEDEDEAEGDGDNGGDDSDSDSDDDSDSDGEETEE